MRERLKIEQVGMLYQAEEGEVQALQDVSFTVGEGEFVSLVGPSGCGKSTLLSIISGLMKPTYGKVLIDGEEVRQTSKHVGYMLQKDNLLEWRTIYSNVLFGLEIRKMLTPDTKRYAKHLIDTYGLGDFINAYPAQLSGGMRQRAALIRTLAVQPDILLLDEAFSALDYQTRLAVTDDVYRIIKRENKTTLMVTHDIPESVSMSDKIVVLTNRPATVKNIHKIQFDELERTPLGCRDHPKFGVYFNEIWKELEIHV